MHINCLELLAATLALKCFAKHKTKISVLLKLDNTTAVTYINNLGGTVSRELVALTRDLWMWCLERNIHIQAQHLPGILNVIADAESRTMTDRTDWKLNPAIFRRIDSLMGPLEVDLFASRLTAQFPAYFSWRPDPFAQATDALVQDWTHIRGFVNPPWALIGRVLSHTQSQQAQVVLLAPIWKTQPWYPVLLEMLVDFPRWIPQHVQVTNNQLVTIPQLAVWRKSTEVSLLLSSWRTKTNKSYDSLFGKWYSWCHRRHTDPFSGPVTEVANFLAHLFTQGYSYNSLNSYRSAISSVHEKRDGYNVGQHPLVTRLLKGVFNDRPPLPRYSSTWNVQTVLNYLEQL